MVEDPRDTERRPRVYGFVIGKRRSRPGSQLWIGLIIVALGALFTLDNLDILDSEPLLRWWPVLIVGFGLSRLVAAPPRRNVTLGLMVTSVGALLLLGSLDVLNVRIWDLWPLWLVFGGAMLVRASFERRFPDAADASDITNLTVVMGGVIRRMNSRQFRGGELTAFMGGIDLDLRGAIPASDTMVIHTLIWWGGIDLKVPKDWRVVNEVMPIMAGIEDKSEPDEVTKATLYLRGSMVMGGIEIKN